MVHSLLRWPQPHIHVAVPDDPSGFVVRTSQGETRAKTRHPDDCMATQTGYFSGWNRSFSSPPTRFWLSFGPQSIRNRSSSTPSRSSKRVRRGSSISSIPPGRAPTPFCRDGGRGMSGRDPATREAREPFYVTIEWDPSHLRR